MIFESLKLQFVVCCTMSSTRNGESTAPLRLIPHLPARPATPRLRHPPVTAKLRLKKRWRPICSLLSSLLCSRKKLRMKVSHLAQGSWNEQRMWRRTPRHWRRQVKSNFLNVWLVSVYYVLFSREHFFTWMCVHINFYLQRLDHVAEWVPSFFKLHQSLGVSSGFTECIN